MRDPKHKALVDAIVDTAVGTKEISKRSEIVVSNLTQSMETFIRAVIKARAGGRITNEKAQALYREMYVGLMLAGFANVAQEALDHGEASMQGIVGQSKMLGLEELLKVAKVSKPDFLQRALDRANGT